MDRRMWRRYGGFPWRRPSGRRMVGYLSVMLALVGTFLTGVLVPAKPPAASVTKVQAATPQDGVTQRWSGTLTYRETSHYFERGGGRTDADKHVTYTAFGDVSEIASNGTAFILLSGNASGEALIHSEDWTFPCDYEHPETSTYQGSIRGALDTRNFGDPPPGGQRSMVRIVIDAQPNGRYSYEIAFASDYPLDDTVARCNTPREEYHFPSAVFAPVKDFAPLQIPSSDDKQPKGTYAASDRSVSGHITEDLGNLGLVGLHGTLTITWNFAIDPCATPAPQGVSSAGTAPSAVSPHTAPAAWTGARASLTLDDGTTVGQRRTPGGNRILPLTAAERRDAARAAAAGPAVAAPRV